MRVHGALLAGVLVLAAGTPASAAGETYLEASALARSEPIGIHDAITGWQGACGSGRRQYAFGRTEFGVRQGAWGLGFVWREEYDLRFTPDTAELYGAVRNDRSLDPGRTYRVDLTAHVLQARGLRLSRRWGEAGGCRLEGGLTLLQGLALIEGRITGTALATGPKAYDYTARVEEAYTEDQLFDRSPARTGPAWGLTPDLRLDWRPAPGWQLRAECRDGLGWIEWWHLPRTTAQAASDRSHEEGADFRRWDPLVSGREYFHTRYSQALSWKGMLEAAHTSGAWTAAAGLDAQFGDWLPRVGGGRTWGACSLLAWLGLRDGSVGLDLRWQAWGIRASLDSLAWERARTASLQITGHW